VPGGGVALVRCMEEVAKLDLKGDEKTGAEIVMNALKMPCYWIAENAGAVGALVVSKVAKGKGGFGYNADKDTYEDLLEAGVIDPVKVTRIALQNAASVAGLLLTTDCVVTEKPKDSKKGSKRDRFGGGPDMEDMDDMDMM